MFIFFFCCWGVCFLPLKGYIIGILKRKLQNPLSFLPECGHSLHHYPLLIITTTTTININNVTIYTISLTTILSLLQYHFHNFQFCHHCHNHISMILITTITSTSQVGCSCFLGTEYKMGRLVIYKDMGNFIILCYQLAPFTHKLSIIARS